MCVYIHDLEFTVRVNRKMNTLPKKVAFQKFIYCAN